MMKDRCDHLEADIDRALRDGAVFSFLSLSQLLASFPAEARLMLDEIIGKGKAPAAPYRVVLVQTSEFPDGKIFLRRPNEHHDSSFILTVSNPERYDEQRFNLERILGRKSQLMSK
jgi:hypothetical protein